MKRWILIYVLSGICTVHVLSCIHAQEAAIEMVRIPAGKFHMGNTSLKDTRPVWEVSLSHDFLLGKHEVTNALFCQVINFLIDSGELRADEQAIWSTKSRQIRMLLTHDDPYYHQFGVEYRAPYIAPISGREAHTVVGVTWHGALEFCNGLSRMQGLMQAYDVIKEECDWSANGYRLPTEAEWKYAARGGDREIEYPWGNTIDPSVANYWGSGNPFADTAPCFCENGGPTTPVGFYSGEVHGVFRTRTNASLFGAYDMGGNVSEWCWDTYQSDYYAIAPTTDPKGRAKGPLIVVARGGSWRNAPEGLRVYVWQSSSPYSNAYAIGFRVVRTLR